MQFSFSCEAVSETENAKNENLQPPNFKSQLNAPACAADPRDKPEGDEALSKTLIKRSD